MSGPIEGADLPTPPPPQVVPPEASQVVPPEAFPSCTIAFYENSKENRYYLGFGDVMNDTTVNHYMTMKLLASCTDNPIINKDDTESFLKSSRGEDIAGTDFAPSRFEPSRFEPSRVESSSMGSTISKFGNAMIDNVSRLIPNMMGGALPPASNLPAKSSAFEKVKFFTFHSLFTTQHGSSANDGIENAELGRMMQFIKSYKYGVAFLRSEDNTTVSSVNQTEYDSVIKWTFISNREKLMGGPLEAWASSGSTVSNIAVVNPILNKILPNCIIGRLGKRDNGIKTEIKKLGYKELTKKFDNLTRGATDRSENLISRMDAKHLTCALFLNVLNDILNDELSELCGALRIDGFEKKILSAIKDDGTFKSLFGDDGDVVPHHCIEELVVSDAGDTFTIYTQMIAANVQGIVSNPIRIRNEEEPNIADLLGGVDNDILVYPDEAKDVLNKWLTRMYCCCIQKGFIDDNFMSSGASVVGLTGGPIVSTETVPIRPLDTIIPNESAEEAHTILTRQVIGGPPIKWVPSSQPGHGKISVNSKELFYDVSTPDVVKDISHITMSKKDDYIFGEKKTRIKQPRDAIMGFFADLVYQPDDVIQMISDTIFKTDGFDYKKRWTNGNKPPENGFYIYIGGFSPDPETPYAFNAPAAPPDGDGTTRNPVNRTAAPDDAATDDVQIVNAAPDDAKPSYNRIHTWLYINTKDVSEASGQECEIYIVNRGSKSGMDWKDTDKNIIEGVGLANDRALMLGYHAIHILGKVNDIYDAINKVNSGVVGTRNADAEVIMWPSVKGKRVQVYSSGHSLGGFLGLALSYFSISRSLLFNVSTTHIKSSNSSMQEATHTGWRLNKFICPIVFDPFVPPNAVPTISMFNLIPKGSIHSVWSDTKRHRDFASSLGVPGLRGGYNSYVDSNTNNGNLNTYKYINVYDATGGVTNISKKMFGEKSPSYQTRNSAIRTSHSMDQITGVGMMELLTRTPTNLYVMDDNDRKQSIQPLRNAVFPDSMLTDEEIRANEYITGLKEFSANELGSLVGTPDEDIFHEVIGPEEVKEDEDIFRDARGSVGGRHRRRKTQRRTKSRRHTKTQRRTKSRRRTKTQRCTKSRRHRKPKSQKRKSNKSKTKRKKYR